MPIIDADTHIDETEATWEYLRDFEQEFKPITQHPSRVDPSKTPVRYWLIDGHRQMRFVRDDNNTRTTVETRELLDVPARLRDMDAMGTLYLLKTEVQVLYRRYFSWKPLSARKCPPRCGAATTAGLPIAAPSPTAGCAGFACRR